MKCWTPRMWSSARLSKRRASCLLLPASSLASPADRAATLTPRRRCVPGAGSLAAQRRLEAADGVAQRSRRRPPAAGDGGQVAQLARQPPLKVLFPN